MTGRRKFRPSNIVTSVPTWDQIKRQPSKRSHELLIGGGNAGDRLNDCFGCAGRRSPLDFTEVSIDMGTLSWGVPTYETCSESYRDTNFPLNGTDYTIYLYSRDLANLTGVQTLELCPTVTCTATGGEVTKCLWRRADLYALKLVWHRTYVHSSTLLWVPATLDIIDDYQLQNPDDPTSEWGYVNEDIDDARCGTLLDGGDGTGGNQGTWQCDTSRYGNIIELMVIDGPDSGTVFSFGSGGTRPWWVCIVNTTRDYLGISVATGTATLAWSQTFATAAWTAPTVNPACISYWPNNVPSVFAGGGTLCYAKPVDCSTDFRGDPIELPFQSTVYPPADRADHLDVVYESSIWLNL